jgi:hypothetical protein
MYNVHNGDRVYKLTILQFSGDLVYFTINTHKVCTVLGRPRKSAKLADVSLIELSDSCLQKSAKLIFFNPPKIHNI